VDAVRVTRWIALFVLTMFAACAWWMAGRRGAPERLAFSHKLHVEDQGLGCEQCHDGIAKADNVSTSYLPVRTTCLECHDLSSCKVCGEVPLQRQPQEVSETTVRFSHKSHVERVGGDCTKCHANAKTATALPVDVPKMSVCLGCHNHAQQYEEAKCAGCHPALQRLPLEAVAEFSHAGDWIQRHGLMARSDGATCLECHPQVMCTSCHSTVQPASPARLYPEQVGRTLIHRGDFLTQHPIDARADGDLCFRCHRTRFCEDCHKTWGLVGQANPNPHPAGWVSPTSPNFHGREAREHIETCAACHDQPRPNCVECHQVGGPGGNPHPSGFLKRHDKDDLNGETCRACHHT
jgi:predicted CXXCH cytochrome family protein